MLRFSLLVTAALCLSSVGSLQSQTGLPKPTPTHVHLPEKDRILNTNGNCGYCSFEMACRFHGIKRGYGLAAKNPAQGIGGHKGCIALIRKLNLKHAYIHDKKNTEFLSYWVGFKKYPVVVAGQNHIVVVVHFAPPLIKIIDNTGEGAGKVRIWSQEKFTNWWNGRAYVVLPDGK